MVYKCKACGGDIAPAEGSVVVCEYCGTTQTIPHGDDEKKSTLFNRATHYRLKCEFDTAYGIFESILADFPQEPEAYWGLCLCRYGIEYVDDPKTEKKIPTCHRTAYESILKDENYEQALQYADPVAKEIYEKEAAEIDRLQRDILSIAQKEEPYDIFICYKEADDDGKRTVDSVLAQDIYTALEREGYRVFFSRITLEDKLGEDYEPYIFSALHSAKIMLAIGTARKYYDAVWVKNEWRRFLDLMKNDKEKKIIPCYRGMDFYDIPDEFHSFQGQDMGKLGFLQDLLRGVKKLLSNEEKKETVQEKETVYIHQDDSGNNITALLKRGMMALEDEEWSTADEFFEQALNHDAECAQAYFGKFLAAQHSHSLDHWYTKAEAMVQSQPATFLKSSEELKEMAQKLADSSNLIPPSGIGDILTELQKANPAVEASYLLAAKIGQTLESDKNLKRARKYAAPDSEIMRELTSLQERADSLLQEKENPETMFARKAKMILSQKEIPLIHQECDLGAKEMARSRDTKRQLTEKMQSEKSELTSLYASYNGALLSKDTCSRLYSDLEHLQLEVFDKEAEIEFWKEKIREPSASQEAQITKFQEYNSELQRLTQEQEETQAEIGTTVTYEDALNYRDSSKKKFSLCAGMAILCAIILLIAVVCYVIAQYNYDQAYQAYYYMSYEEWAANKNIFLSIIVCSGIFLLISLVLALICYNEHKDTTRSLLDIARHSDELQDEIDSLNAKIAECKKQLEIHPHPVLKRLPRLDVINYSTECPLYYQELQDEKIRFEIASDDFDLPAQKNAVLFCYEKRGLYPVEILEQEQTNLVLTIPSIGLSIKLAGFAKEDHFLLLWE